MKDFAITTLALSCSVWCCLGFAYVDMGMLLISAVHMLIMLALIIGSYIYDRYVLTKLPKFTAIAYGDEWFLRDERGVMHPSHRSEVSDLMLSKQIIGFE